MAELGSRKKELIPTDEREALTKKGEKKLRDIRLQITGKTKESELKHPITKKEIARRRKASK